MFSHMQIWWYTAPIPMAVISLHTYDAFLQFCTEFIWQQDILHLFKMNKTSYQTCIILPSEQSIIAKRFLSHKLPAEGSSDVNVC